MRPVISLYRSSVGKKIMMALTGVLLFGFVLAHMIGNLKIFLGQEHFDAYAHFLRTVGEPALAEGQLLWIARLVLLAAVGVHLLAAWQVTRQSWSARDVSYKKMDDQSFAYASRTMRWGGVILAAFVVYHLLHFTVGTVHPDFDPRSPYANVVRGFQAWPVALAYVVALLSLALHLYHGLWSATQTLALTNTRVLKWRRPVALGIAVLVALGYMSVPLGVLAGVIKPVSVIAGAVR